MAIENDAVRIVSSFPSNTHPSARFNSYEHPSLNPFDALTVYTPFGSASSIFNSTLSEPSFTTRVTASFAATSPDTFLILKVTSGLWSIWAKEVMFNSSFPPIS